MYISFLTLVVVVELRAEVKEVNEMVEWVEVDQQYHLVMF
jgi:hypothetical protein